MDTHRNLAVLLLFAPIVQLSPPLSVAVRHRQEYFRCSPPPSTNGPHFANRAATRPCGVNYRAIEGTHRLQCWRI